MIAFDNTCSDDPTSNGHSTSSPRSSPSSRRKSIATKFKGARKDIDQARHMTPTDELVLPEEKELTRTEAMDKKARERGWKIRGPA